MPTRLIREGILTSEKVDQLDPPSEVFYRRLLSKVDDHGLYDARPSILRATLFPLRIDKVREADCSRWMAACQKAGLIVLYEADSKPYLKALNTQWDARSKPKYPLPSGVIDNSCKQPETTENTSTVVVDVVVSESAKRPRSAFAPPDWLPADAWQGFEEHRRKIRKPMTDKARQLIVAELEKLKPADPVAILEQSIRNGWQDVFPIRANGSAGKPAFLAPPPVKPNCRKCGQPILGTHTDGMHDACWESR